MALTLYHPWLCRPVKSLDEDMVTLLNLPYVTAVATAGSETDLLRVGTATGSTDSSEAGEKRRSDAGGGGEIEAWIEAGTGWRAN